MGRAWWQSSTCYFSPQIPGIELSLIWFKKCCNLSYANLVVHTWRRLIIHSLWICLHLLHSFSQFEDTEEDDVTNWTNRSPYPLFHLLLEKDVTVAVEAYDGDTDIIWETNQVREGKGGVSLMSACAHIRWPLNLRLIIHLFLTSVWFRTQCVTLEEMLLMKLSTPPGRRHLKLRSDTHVERRITFQTLMERRGYRDIEHWEVCYLKACISTAFEICTKYMDSQLLVIEYGHWSYAVQVFFSLYFLLLVISWFPIVLAKTRDGKAADRDMLSLYVHCNADSFFIYLSEDWELRTTGYCGYIN